MAGERDFLDANILIYAVGAPSLHKESCAEVLRAVADYRLRAVTSVEVLQEILHLYTRRNQRAQAVMLAEELAGLVEEVLPLTEADFRRALHLHTQFPWLSARDSLHAAVMYGNDLAQILTVDAHFDGLPGIERIAPDAWLAANS